MIKKIALPLLVASTFLSLSNYAQAKNSVIYAGIGIGFSLTTQHQGTLEIANQLPINIQTKSGSLSGSGFLGVSPSKYLSLETDFEYTEVDNEIKRDDIESQEIWGNKPITTILLTPLLNLVIRTPDYQGLGLFAMAGIGGSYMKTTVTHDKNPDFDIDPPTDKYSQFTRAYDVGGGLFYNIPDSSMSLSAGFRYINLGGTFTKKDFALKATSKEEVFLRLTFGF